MLQRMLQRMLQDLPTFSLSHDTISHLSAAKPS
jgi:hypothetical protein